MFHLVIYWVTYVSSGDILGHLIHLIMFRLVYIGSLDTSDHVSSGDILGHLIHLIMFRLVIYWVT